MKIRTFMKKEVPKWMEKAKNSSTTTKVIVASIIMFTLGLKIAFFLKDLAKDLPPPPEA